LALYFAFGVKFFIDGIVENMAFLSVKYITLVFSARTDALVEFTNW